MSKIKSIEEATFDHISSGYNSSFDGYVITCDDETTIKVGIDNSSQCCENWGYLTSEDDLKDFIGASVIQVAIVDEALATTVVPELYEGGTMFVNIETDKGKFQIVAYNDHNGYYSHEAVVVQNGVATETQYL